MDENEKMLKKLDQRLADGEISQELYNEIVSRYKKSEENTEDEIEEEIIDEEIEDVSEKETKTDEKTKKVKITGATRIDSCNCEIFRAAGASGISGDLIADDAKISGATKVNGNVYIGKLSSSGALKVLGKTEGEKLDVSGASKFEKDVKVDVIEASGSFKVDGDVVCETMNASGAVHIKNVLRGDIALKLSDKSKIKKIEGGDVVVESGGSGFFSFGFRKTGSLDVESITGNDIYLENTKAENVMGSDVVIGPGCKIQTVKAKNLKVHESATVKNKKGLKDIKKK